MRLLMNKILFIIMIFMILMGGSLIAQTHFEPPEGNPFSPMNIYIIGAKYLDGNDIVAGTEVGIFSESRPETCVGAAVLPGAVNPFNPVEIRAHKDDGENSGFIEGDAIIYKLWDPSIQREFELKTEEVNYFDPETGESIESMQFAGLGTAAVEFKLVTFIPVEESNSVEVPEKIELLQNFPNPFNPSTNIVFHLSEHSYVSLDIFDINGKFVTNLYNGEPGLGTKNFKWNGLNSSNEIVASGLYFYRLKTDNITITKKMLFQK